MPDFVTAAPDAEDNGYLRIKYIPALVIVIMFASVVFGTHFLRRGGKPEPASQVIFMQDEKGPAEKETLPVDSLFDFDKAVLKSDALERIRNYAEKAKALSNVNVVVIGHADALGSERHNDTLSSARANAVRQALIAAGLDPARVTAAGVGARIPVKVRDQCPGSALDPKVIACFEPNRRVELWAKPIQN